ncbi:phosphate ABC transporter permease PstA [Candidatus Entotheonella palauensis]|uniref:phosphate ABC transporter permease PstA n=1 Tax=Candidatus Entotheonella palauensis TaxID=93172 RepID=UPI000B7D2BE2|nr:phosphate ABC transporter permease PstA [Candidatus Entotheonella palauensis]
MQSFPDRAKKVRQTAGEPYVWFTGMGLMVGLLMVIFLLGLIVVNGFQAFWPKRVAQVMLKETSPVDVKGSKVIAGEIIKKRQKTLRALTREQDGGASDARPTEWQLFLGNKDAYGFSFRYFDFDDIAQVTYPDAMMVIERLEYGDAIALPAALDIQGEGTLPTAEPRFKDRLHHLVTEVNQRWQTIKNIEKFDIGAINARLSKLRLQQSALDRARREGATVSDARQQALNETMTALNQSNEELRLQARALRSKQNDHTLVYCLPTGEERRLPLGQVVHYYYPNTMTFWQRVGLLWHNIRVFLAHEPREANTEGGVFPAIFGTCVMTILMSLAVTPFGVVAAIYLREYAKQGFVVRAVRIAVNNLAGVPSIVFGVFGLGFFVYLVGGTIDELFFHLALPTPTFGTGGVLWASLTLALMTVPVVIVATEEALAAVPRGMREGSLACGASKWQTMQRIVIPAAAPGILTGLILAMARGAGEVAPLMLVGVVKLAPSLPVDSIFPFVHLERKFMHLGFHIYDLGFQSPDSEAAIPMVFATTLLLISLVVLMNLGAIFIRERLRRKYATGAF